MAYGKPEQICSWEWSRHYKKWLKKAATKWRRRIERTRPEGAPWKNEYHGWSV